MLQMKLEDPLAALLLITNYAENLENFFFKRNILWALGQKQASKKDLAEKFFQPQNNSFSGKLLKIFHLLLISMLKYEVEYMVIKLSFSKTVSKPSSLKVFL